MALGLPAFHASQFFIDDAISHHPAFRLNTQAWWMSVVLFGVGYAIVARDPTRNHGIVGLAMVGKTYVGLAWIAGFISGVVGMIGLIGAVGDLVFAAIFAAFLANPPAGPSRETVRLPQTVEREG